VRRDAVAVWDRTSGYQMAVVDFVRPDDADVCIEATAVREHKITLLVAAIDRNREYFFPLSDFGQH
jgi:hypothetical protein